MKKTYFPGSAGALTGTFSLKAGLSDSKSGFYTLFKKLMTNAAFCLSLLLITFMVSGQNPSNIRGIAPVKVPQGGMAIDGDIWALTPGVAPYATAGDWFPSPTLGGGSLYTQTTTGDWKVIDPWTFKVVDDWNGKDSTIFTTSNKINDNPKTYTWGLGNVPQKNEIENACVHFSYGDPALPGGKADEIWAVFAADRMVTNGASYIDFEFLQNRLIKYGKLSGGFTSFGQDSGRTVGDILITIEFSQGGGTANAVLRQWEQLPAGGFAYVEISPQLYADYIFISNNTEQINNVPCDVYGGTTYLVNQWAEGAINLSQVMGLKPTINPCRGISTVFIRTRTSGEPATAELTDFPGDPIFVGIEAEDPVVTCPENVTVEPCTNLTLAQEAYLNWLDGFSYNTGVLTATEAFDPVPPAQLPDDASCKGFEITTVYTVTDYCGDTGSCTSTFKVLPDLTKPVIADKEDIVLTGCNPEWPAKVETTWSDNCGESGTLAGVAGEVVTEGCNQYRDYTFNVSDKCGNQAITVAIRVTRHWDKTAAVIVDLADYQLADCNAAWPAKLTTTWTDNCGVLGQTSGNVDSNGGVDVIAEGCVQSRMYTFSVTDDCGNASSQTVTVSRKWDKIAPSIVDLADYQIEGCNPEWPAKLSTTWTDNCGVGSKTSGSMDSNGGVNVITDACVQTRLYTFTLTDDCGNSSAQTVTVSRKWDKTAPSIVDIADYQIEGCNPAWPAKLTTSWSENCSVGGQTNGNLDSDGGKDVITDACVQTRIFTFSLTDDCGNTAIQTVTVSRKWDKTAPAIVDIPDYLLAGCNAEWPAKLTTTWTDNCGVQGNTSGNLDSDTGANIEVGGCVETRKYTFTLTDDCGNSAMQTVTVSRKSDKTAPVVADVADYMLEGCNPVWPVKLTTTWSDNCGFQGKTSGNLDSDGGVNVITDACIQTRLYTFTLTDDCGNSASQTVTVSRKWDKTPPQLSSAPLTDITVTCAETVVLPHPEFTDNCPGDVTLFCSIPDHPEAICGNFKFPAGETDVCFWAKDACGNMSEPICITVKVLPCEFCTYTQGKYGNQDKSTACVLGPDKIPTKQMVSNLLALGDLKIGAGSNYILFKAGDAAVINSILPGGGGCNLLSGICVPSGTVAACMSPYLSKQGRLNSGFVAQTLTLGLNLRISKGLGDIELVAGKWFTTQKKLDCAEGSGVLKMVCTPVYEDPANPTVITGYITTVNPYRYVMFPEGVLCFMAQKGYSMTIGGLFNLANDVLGGVVTIPNGTNCGGNAVNACSIQSAVDMINNAFDECRAFVGNLDKKFECPTVSKMAVIQPGASFVQVYPNPFNQVATFEFTSQKDAQAVLELYNSLGQKVQTLLDQKVEQGVQNRVEYKPVNQIPGVFIYQLKLADQVFVGKLVYNKSN